MRSLLVFLGVAAVGTTVALVLGPLWLVGVLAAGLILALVITEIERSARLVALDEAHGADLLDVDDRSVALLYSPTGELLRTSASLHAVLGIRPDDFSGLRVDEFVAAADVDRVRDAFIAVRHAPRAIAALDVSVRTPDAWQAMRVEIVNATEVADLDGFVVRLRDNEFARSAQERLAASAGELDRMATLIGQALKGSDEATLSQATVAAARDCLGADVVELYRSTDGAMELVAGLGPGGIALDRDSTTDQGLALARTTAEADGPVTEPGPGLDGCTAIALAIRGSHRADGALVVRSSVPRDIDPADVAFLSSLAGLIALARRQRGAEQDAFRRSRHDELTGLVNRDVFLQRLRTSVNRSDGPGEMVGVLLVDLDHFKIVNDSLGHSAGDALLGAVSDRLTSGLRPGDTLARFGGDEFVVLTRGLGSADQASLAAKRMQSVLAEPFRIAGHDVQVTASVGVAVCADPTVEPEALLQHADAALYRAKELGRERVERFDPTMLEAAVTRLRTEEELRAALTDDQLRVFYQPIVDLGTGQTHAVEALVRWIHPGRGLVTPGEFIPISEATGLIEEIGAWVVNESCRQIASWMTAGTPLQVSINVSARQLRDPAFIDMIDRAVAQHEIPASHLAVELTETVLMQDLSSAMTTLHALHDRGITIAIDDFGMGSSSLSYLKSLPVDIVKIDRAFVSGIDRSGDDYAIISAMIRLAQTLGKAVVAEGVETEQQLELLRDLGCDLAQGFLFSPAVFEIDHGSDDHAWSELVLDSRR